MESNACSRESAIIVSPIHAIRRLYHSFLNGGSPSGGPAGCTGGARVVELSDDLVHVIATFADAKGLLRMSEVSKVRTCDRRRSRDE
jgi:hypothetical protein